MQKEKECEDTTDEEETDIPLILAEKECEDTTECVEASMPKT
jgi:hypothetical protein